MYGNWRRPSRGASWSASPRKSEAQNDRAAEQPPLAIHFFWHWRRATHHLLSPQPGTRTLRLMVLRIAEVLCAVRAVDLVWPSLRMDAASSIRHVCRFLERCGTDQRTIHRDDGD